MVNTVSKNCSLEHVQEYTKALEESSDEEEEEMPAIQLKSHERESPVSASERVSVRKLCILLSYLKRLR